MTENGRFVLFYSEATNLAPKPDPSVATAVYLRDMQQQTTVFLQASPPFDVGGTVISYSISNDGRYFAFAIMSTTTVGKAFLRDRNGPDHADFAR